MSAGTEGNGAMTGAARETALRSFARAAVERNPAAVQLLGLCPLLAVSNTVANAAGLAVASAGVLVGSSLLAAALRPIIPSEVRLPCYVLLIATFTTVAMLLMQAYALELYQRIALFVQIIVTNCVILAHIEQSRAAGGAASGGILRALVASLGAAVGFALALLTMGAVRELLAVGFPLAAMAPGAFLVAGVVLALTRLAQGVLERSPSRRLGKDPTGR